MNFYDAIILFQKNASKKNVKNGLESDTTWYAWNVDYWFS
jgi:hypothetical protein